MERIIFNLVGNGTRRDYLHGQEYLVVPCAMLTEGVHVGSNGPLLYLNEELSDNPVVWNTKPVVVYHPVVNGEGVSACSPEILESRQIGLLMNSHYDDKLRTEVWLNESKTKEVDDRILSAIEKNQLIEVSTGVFTKNEEIPGVWNGEKYNAIARQLRPDHLAILPDQKGACSIADGAGLLQLNAELIHENEVLQDLADRWPAAKRHELDKADFGDPEKEAFPIKSQKDVESAASLLHHSKDPEAVKTRIKSIIKRKGLKLPKTWEDKTDNVKTSDRNANDPEASEYLDTEHAPSAEEVTKNPSGKETNKIERATSGTKQGKEKDPDASARGDKPPRKISKAQRIGANEEGGLETFKEEEEDSKMTTDDENDERAKSKKKINGTNTKNDAKLSTDKIKANADASHEHLRAAMQKALGKKFPYSWVTDLFPKDVIYESGGVTYSTGWEADPQDSKTLVKLKGPVKEVVRKPHYVTVDGSYELEGPSNNQEVRKELSMLKTEIVDQLVGNGAFPESEREWLNSLPENRLNLLVMNARKTAPDDDDDDDDDEEEMPKKKKKTDNASKKKKMDKEEEREDCPATNARAKFITEDPDTKKAQDAKTEEEDEDSGLPAKKAKKKKINQEEGIAGRTDNAEPNLEEFLKSTPPGLRTLLTNALRQQEQEKNELIESLVNNKRNLFTREFLAEKDVDELKALNHLADSSDKTQSEQPRRPKYIGQGQDPMTNASYNALPLPAPLLKTGLTFNGSGSADK